MQWITIKEAADLARVHRNTIQTWIRKGAVQAVRANPASSRVLVRRSDVDPDQQSTAQHKSQHMP